jgi:hypothetical protein
MGEPGAACWGLRVTGSWVLQLEVADWVSFGRLQFWRPSQGPSSRWPMNTRREEEVIIADGHKERGEGFSVLVQVASGLMKATRHQASCFPRVYYLM